VNKIFKTPNGLHCILNSTEPPAVTVAFVDFVDKDENGAWKVWYVKGGPFRRDQLVETEHSM
jgi:hypothetical protein